jgi:4-amino-4-deoxy-L-arabinose transferase-like glycosyltransferase
MAKKLSLLLCALMGCIIALAVAGNLYWCVRGQTFTGPDVGNHLIFSVEYYYKLTGLFSAGAGSLAWRAVQLVALPLLPVAHSSPLYPNVVYGLTSLWYLVFGQSLAVAKLSNLLFLAVLAVSTYLLGRRFSSREGGALAAALVVLYPAVYESSRQYGLDLPLAAMTALCMLLLVESDTLGREKLVLPLGLVTGIGILVKPQLLLFLAVPLLVVLARVLRDRTVEGPVRRRNLRQCALAAGIVVAIAFLVIQQIESNVLLPRLSGHAVGIHPIGSILALVFGFEVGGVIGALFAVPVAGLLWVLISTALAAWRGRRVELHRRLERRGRPHILSRPRA